MIQGVVLFTLALAVLMYVYVLELMFCLKIAVECVALVPEVEWAQATCYEHAIVAPSFAGKGTEVAVLGREAGEESWKNEALHTIQARTSHSSDTSILQGRNLVLAKIGRKSQRLEYRCHVPRR